MPISFPCRHVLVEAVHFTLAMLSKRLLLHTQKKVELFITTDVLLTLRCRRLRWGRCGLSRTDCRPLITIRKMNGLLHFRFHWNRTARPVSRSTHWRHPPPLLILMRSYFLATFVPRLGKRRISPRPKNAGTAQSDEVSFVSRHKHDSQ